LAGMEPASVIVEILNDDGSMARLPDLEKFAATHGLKIGTIADLIRYRMEKEQSVERIGEQTVQTEFGEFRAVCFEDYVHRTVHFALVRGDIDPVKPALVRVHLQNTLSDVMGLSWHTPQASTRRTAPGGSAAGGTAAGRAASRSDHSADTGEI